jgi:hypothetical protein
LRTTDPAALDQATEEVIDLIRSIGVEPIEEPAV